MGNGLTIEVERAGALKALELLGKGVEVYTHRAARETANRVCLEARSRVARATGKTQAGLVVEDDYGGIGYVVKATRSPMPNVPLWLETGTVHMSKREFFFASARLEAGAYERRMLDAIAQAVQEANR